MSDEAWTPVDPDGCEWIVSEPVRLPAVSISGASRHRWGEIHIAMMVIEDFAKKHGEKWLVSRATLRSWVHRKYVSHYDRLYDLTDLVAHLHKRMEKAEEVDPAA